MIEVWGVVGAIQRGNGRNRVVIFYNLKVLSVRLNGLIVFLSNVLIDDDGLNPIIGINILWEVDIEIQTIGEGRILEKT